MLASITKIEAAGYLAAEEAAEAQLVEAMGASHHTLGFELEIMPDAVDKVPRLAPDVGASKPAYHSRAVMDCKDTLYALGFDVNIFDGLYEIISPPARHALPLATVTRGLVKAGVLPKRADHDVTAHVSIGSPAEIQSGSLTHHRLIRMLRMVEMLGGSTGMRLLGHLVSGERSQYTWHGKGLLGVYPHAPKNGHKTVWHGESRRVELRSLAYTDAEQFGQTLEMIYYLSRGLLTWDSLALQEAVSLDNWFRGYQSRYGMLNFVAEQRSSSQAEFEKRAAEKRAALAEYLQPYVAHMEAGDRDELRTRTMQTIAKLRTQFNMDDVPSLLDLGVN